MYAGDSRNPQWEAEFNNYNGSKTLYYAGTETTNHAVVIVGWDDNLTHAGGKGGWIVKNSWGNRWGGTCGYGTEKGYFTIAYGSANIGEYASFLRNWQDYDPNGALLYYDEAGWNSSLGYDNKTAWGLCKFIPNKNTWITRVEFWTTDVTTDVDVYIYDSFNGSRLSQQLFKRENLSYSEAGYHSLRLQSPLRITSGNDVIAVVKFTNANSKFPIAADTRGPTQGQRTYISPTGHDGSWSDTITHNANMGIRLRTSDVPEATSTPTRTPTCTPTLGPTVWGPYKLYLPVICKN